MTAKEQTIHIIAGPTASGKSARAVELAHEKDGVIINCDSIQIYDALPILSAQPTQEDKAQAPHRLYGVLHPDNICSAGNWREMVEPVIEDVLAEGRTPIICGGTGLYIKALTDGLSPIPDIPHDVRNQAMVMQGTLDASTLHAELKFRDPIMAARLDPNNKARLIRAWEVLEATGKSLSEWQKLPPVPPPAHWNFQIEVIIPERETLYKRCNERFLSMLENGALEEAEIFGKELENATYKAGTPVTKALGFASLWAFLKGEQPKEEAIAQAQAQTRRYAKRQVTWFRNQT